jgi:hypothetical protein
MKNGQHTVVISGSFRRHYDAIKTTIKSFEKLDIKVLSPKNSEIVNPGEEVAVLATDDTKNPETLERRHLDAIQKADALYVCNPEGYLGASSILELGWANALGKPIFSSEQAADGALKFFPEMWPRRNRLKKCWHNGLRSKPSIHGLQLLHCRNMFMRW